MSRILTTKGMGCVSAALLSAGSFLPLRGGAASVYMVPGSDTADWNVPGGIDTSKYRNHFAPDLYAQPQNPHAPRRADPISARDTDLDPQQRFGAIEAPSIVGHGSA